MPENELDPDNAVPVTTENTADRIANALLPYTTPFIGFLGAVGSYYLLGGDHQFNSKIDTIVTTGDFRSILYSFEFWSVLAISVIVGMYAGFQLSRPPIEENDILLPPAARV